MSEIAMIVGYAVMIGLAGAACLMALGLLVLGVALYCPFRFDWHTKLPSQLVTPHGTYDLTALVGVSGRWAARWHFGFMLLKPASRRSTRMPLKKQPIPKDPSHAQPTR